MVAALLKIVSTGMQDEYLQPPKDQPQLSAFMTVLVKAGRFGTQWVRVDFDTRPDFGTAAVARLPVQGELISKVFLVTEMPDIYTAQRQAFNFFPGIPPVNSNYQVQTLYSGGEYKSSVTYIYEEPAGGTTWDFRGIQLEGLVAGQQYSIQFEVPNQTITLDPLNPQCTFSTWLSDSAFQTSDFSLLKRDTFLLQGFFSTTEPTYDGFQYSYDGLTWTPSTIPTVPAPLVLGLVYTASKYIAIGSFIAPDSVGCITSSTGALTTWSAPITPSGISTATTLRFAVYGSTVIAFLDQGILPSGGAQSSDGITFTAIPGAGIGYERINHAVYVPYLNNWIAVGDFNSPSTMTATSPDPLINGWSPGTPIFTDFEVVSPPTVIRLILSANSGTYYRMFIGGRNKLTSTNFSFPIGLLSSSDPSYVYPPLTGFGFDQYRLIEPSTCNGIAIRRDDSTFLTAKNDFAVGVGSYATAGGWTGSILVSRATEVDNIQDSFGDVWNTPIRPGNATSTFTDSILYNGLPPPIQWSSSIFIKIKNNLPYTERFNLSFSDGITIVSSLAFQVELLSGQTSTIYMVPVLKNGSGAASISLDWGALNPPLGGTTILTFDGTNLNTSFVISGLAIPEVPRILLESTKAGATGTGNDVAWNGSLWVAVGQWTSGTISTSADGITWSVPFNPTGTTSGTPVGRGISWNATESKWVAAGLWGTNLTIATSTDGIAWTFVGPPLLVLSDGYASETYNGTSLAGGFYTKEGSGNFTSSTDGISWSTPVYPININLVGTRDCFGVAHNGTLSIAVGSWILTSTSTVAQFASSTDGISWIAFQPGTLSTVGSTANTIAWNGSYWLMGGTGYPGGIISKSTNGTTWSAPVSIAGSVGSIRSLAWNGSYWLAGGKFTVGIANTYTGSIAKSTDGVTWTIVLNVPDFFDNSVNSIVWSGSFWLAATTVLTYVPLTGVYSYKFLYKSFDGVTWTEVSIPFLNEYGIDPCLIFVSLTWTGTTWVGVGKFNGTYDGNYFETTTLISSDGINWRPTGNLATPATISSTSVVSQRTLPMTTPPFFNPVTKYAGLVSGTEEVLPPTVTPGGISFRGGFLRTFNANTSYGAARQWLTYPANNTFFTTIPSFTFVPTKTQMFLTYGAYQYSGQPVRITISFVGETPPYTISPWIGPHFGWTNSLGHAVINEVSFSLGGNLMDTIPGQLMEVLDEFQTPLEKTSEYSNLILRKENGFSQRSYGYTPDPTKVITPLPFWFSRDDPGCHLPIDALYVDEARITVRYRPLTSTYYTDSRATDASGRAIQTQVEGGALWPILGSKFYYNDPSGSLVAGLEPIENPTTKVSVIPGIRMPTTLTMGNSYLLVQYIYLDKPEANRFRIADLQIPVVQHYSFDPVDNERNNFVRIPMFIPNPTRDIFFYCQRYTAPGYNAHFLGSRDLSSSVVPVAPWWPDASGLAPEFYSTLRPGFSTRDTEPLRWLALTYEETLVRYSTENVALFRSVLPCIEQRKAPWVNRFYYNLPFGTQNGFTPFSMPIGQANLDKIQRTQLVLGFHGQTGCLTADYVDRYWTRIFAETYNILRIYGGRGAMMFAY